MTATRTRLPNRRSCETHSLTVGNVPIVCTIGFDVGGKPRKVFLTGARDGSGLAAILDDASVVISVSLQFGVPAAALAKSVARIPETVNGTATLPASPIGAVLICWWS
jgi:hypothetical protein